MTARKKTDSTQMSFDFGQDDMSNRKDSKKIKKTTKKAKKKTAKTMFATRFALYGNVRERNTIIMGSTISAAIPRYSPCPTCMLPISPATKSPLNIRSTSPRRYVNIRTIHSVESFVLTCTIRLMWIMICMKQRSQKSEP